MATLIRCYNCRTDNAGTMFDKALLACPECDAPRRGFSSHLNTAKLNNHLYAAAEGNDRQGYMSAKQAARDYVDAVM